MDVSFNNVLEGTRQYFMGVPKPVTGGGAAWSAQAGPAEPLEPEPHIIHKATVMREALEKRREQPDAEDEPASPARPPTAPPEPARVHPYPRAPALRPPAPRPSSVPPPRACDRVPPLHPPRAPYPAAHYDRHAPAPRKFDPQHAYPGYRPAPAPHHPSHAPHQPGLPPGHAPGHAPPHPSVHTTGHAPPHPSSHLSGIASGHHPARHHTSAQHSLPNHHALAPTHHTQTSSHHAPYRAEPARTQDRPVHLHEAARVPRLDHPSMNRSIDARHFHYPSSSRYLPASVPPEPALPLRTEYRAPPAPASKTPFEPPAGAARIPAAMKAINVSQQPRMTVSVTSLVNQMNQTKQKRESPLDLSVKTVKNSADSSTTQDDAVDSASAEKAIPNISRPSPSTRPSHSTIAPVPTSHKVDFAPDFGNQYRDRSAMSHGYPHPAPVPVAVAPAPARYNGTYDTGRPPMEPYPTDHRPTVYPDRGKYSVPPTKSDYVPRIDLTRGSDRLVDSRLRDDRHYVIEERKRTGGPIVNNIPEKIVRYETWSADSRIDRMSRSAREQQELMSRPVYSYSSHKRFEAYQSEQKVQVATPYRDPHVHPGHRYPYHPETATRTPTDYHHLHYMERNASTSRNVIQKLPSHRDLPPHFHHHHHVDHHTGVPADKRVLSILRNSLETKQTGVEQARPAKQVPELIVIDDADDNVIEITDLTRENEHDKARNAKYASHVHSNVSHSIHMPKAVDSIPRELDSRKNDDAEIKNKSPENDFASRIKTKGELKGLPPSHESSVRPELKSDNPIQTDKNKLIPKSQKQHLFNQMREENLRFESVIKNEVRPETVVAVKTEPISIEEIEKDAVVPIKLENPLEAEAIVPAEPTPSEDLDWMSACDSFVEQLKTGCHKKKPPPRSRRRIDTDAESNAEKQSAESKDTSLEDLDIPLIKIKQEPVDDEDKIDTPVLKSTVESCELVKEKEQINETTKDSKDVEYEKPNKVSENVHKESKEKKKKEESPKGIETVKKVQSKDKNSKDRIKEKKINKYKKEQSKTLRRDRCKDKDSPVKSLKDDENTLRNKQQQQVKSKKPKVTKSVDSPTKNEKEVVVTKSTVTKIKEEPDSTDDDEPLIKSKMLKQKEESDRQKYQILKDLSEKSAYVKLECFDAEITKSSRKSLDSATLSIEKERDETLMKQISNLKGNCLSTDVKTEKEDINSGSDSDNPIITSRLRVRKPTKTEETKPAKSPVKGSSKKQDLNCTLRKPGFGDGSDFHPGWEEELYRYKRSLRMPTRLIAIPRGRSGGPFARTGSLFARGTTSLPDLDPAPLSPTLSSTPSAATDDLYNRRQDKLALDSDLDSNSSCSVHKHYDSEASTSTIFSSSKKKGSSIVDVLIQKCGRKEDSKKRIKDKDKSKDDTPKLIPKNKSDLLPTPGLGLDKGKSFSVKKDKLMEDIFYLGAFRKETVTAFRKELTKNPDVLMATEDLTPKLLKSRTRTVSRVLRQRATIKEVFGEDRPASAPPTACREEDQAEEEEMEMEEQEVKKERESKTKPTKKQLKDKLLRRSNSIRDGLRSTQSLKRNDAKGRLLRLKNRNKIMKNLTMKRMKEFCKKKEPASKSPSLDGKDEPREETNPGPTDTKRRFKRLFARRKFSSGFDYIRKKKKIIRREEGAVKRIRRVAPKASPESENDIHKEIKGWFVNKSVGETHLHRAARLGYTDCVAYCLEKMSSEASARDNAGFTPLHVAAARGHVRIARLLLQYGANVSAAAQGGIRPLHEASENNHVEMIRLLLAYGADPVLGTYAGQTPLALADGGAARLLRAHIADVQGHGEPWQFASPALLDDKPEESGCDPLASPPPASPPPPEHTIEIQCTDAPLPPFYTLRGPGPEGLWCLLQDVTSALQIKSKESLLKQIHCGSGSPKELLREIRTQEFLERAQCHQLLAAGEKVNVRASKVALVRVTDKLRQLLKIETVLVS